MAEQVTFTDPSGNDVTVTRTAWERIYKHVKGCKLKPASKKGKTSDGES